mgnify:CR=1 FL=1|jgi:hypothetical protein
MRIKNKFIDKNNIENITFLTRSSMSAIRQLRAGEPVYICANNFTPTVSENKVN